jgi:Tfp pilus assembly protein PilV
VALAILGIAIVSLMQLFSSSLRTTKKSGDYTIALIHARSLMAEAYATPSIDDIEGSFDFDGGYTATREATEISTAEEAEEDEEQPPFKFYEITVTVKWPPSGMTVLKGRRVVYGEAL